MCSLKCVNVCGYMDEAYPRVLCVTALLVAMSVSFCLPHAVQDKLVWGSDHELVILRTRFNSW